MDIRTTPPPNAMILFAGKILSDWTAREGGKPGWKVEGGFLEVSPGAGDILTHRRFRDFFLHLEFRCPEGPRGRGQERANSGVYLQGRYELQILDSWGVEKAGDRDCGAFYELAAPLINASRPPTAWQTFEVIFRAARGTGSGIEPARATVLQNGMVIHNNLPLPRATPGALEEADPLAPGPLLLQEHRAPVAFRRVWLLPLPENG